MLEIDYTSIVAKLHELNFISLLVRSLLALMIGGILGFERGKNNRPAGFRTHMLVCYGAALVMMTNQFVYQTYHVSDPVRLGAQVISGIGFLGAGSIIMSGRGQVHGITTAAGLWAAACCGLAAGIGFYSGAIVSGVVIYGIMATMRRLGSRIQDQSSIAVVYLEMQIGVPFSRFLIFAAENELSVFDVQMRTDNTADKSAFCATLNIKSRIKRTHAQILEILRSTCTVQFVEII
ncbi:MAG: MgtC/SapB family protein [Termitinemataceae bacterium]|nr:MAG: MgtC/SapB family protein [Termitinemataceae bacterium]